MPTHSQLSNAEAAVQPPLYAAILYPSLGAPTFIRDNKLHLVLLGPKKLTSDQVLGHLRLFTTFDDLKKAKTTGKSALLAAGQAGIVASAADITTRALTFDPASEQLEVPEIGLAAILHTKVLNRWKQSGAPYHADLSTLHHVSVDLLKLHPNLVQKLGVLPPRLFLEWFDARNPGAPFPQDHLLRQILLESKDSDGLELFIGPILGAALKSSRQGNLALPSLNARNLLPDANLLATDLHPAYFEAPNQNTRNIAFMGDLHMVTKFRLLGQSDIKVVPKGEGRDLIAAKLLPPVGKLLLDTVDTLESHFGQIANDPSVEVLVIGGDLVDFHKDNFPTDNFRQAIRQAVPDGTAHRQIWEACRLPDHSTFSADKAYEPTLKDRYQAGSAALGFHRMVTSFVAGTSKPFFLAIGNHDGYKLPFGVWPRFNSTLADNGEEDPDGSGGSGTNTDIPGDANLTILEACLVFGPTYGQFLKSLNLSPEVMELAYLLYTPFRSWTLRTAAKHQMLILDWGDEEDMIRKQEGTWGHLPHASKSTSDRDLKIVAKADELATADTRLIVASHYTYVCYDPKIPIYRRDQLDGTRTNKGSFELGEKTNSYNLGTFRSSREKVFTYLQKKDKIVVTLSGHAHRSGIYKLGAKTGRIFKDIEVDGWNFSDFRTIPQDGYPLIVVTDSAGPLPRVNQGDVFHGVGCAPSAWTKVTFSHADHVSQIVAVTPDRFAQPRITVPLDYRDAYAMEKDVKGMLKLDKSGSNIVAWREGACPRFTEVKELDLWKSTIFTSFVSEPIDQEMFLPAAPQGDLHLFGPDPATLLPPRVLIRDMALILPFKADGQQPVAIPFAPIPPGGEHDILHLVHNGRGMWQATKDTSPMAFARLQGMFWNIKAMPATWEFDAWMVCSFGGDSTHYKLATPWIVRLKGKVIKESRPRTGPIRTKAKPEPSARIILHRHPKFNERPDFRKYL